MAKKKATVYQVPNSKVTQNSKLQSGEEFSPKMVGAYYGSSFEYNVSMRLQYANGKNVECPASEELTKILKPKYAHGEFGAEIASENQDFPASKREIGRCLVELATIEEVRQVRQAYDRLSIPTKLTTSLDYRNVYNQQVKYQTLFDKSVQMRQHNADVQARKDQAIREAGCAPVWKDGKKISPAYPQALLDTLSSLNNELWTATGVNLVITYTGLHTIAKDSKFLTGSLDQAGLDTLAGMLDYKEVESFWKGTLRSAQISIPIQNKGHLNQAIKWLEEIRGQMNIDWPTRVRDSLVVLEKVKP